MSFAFGEHITVLRAPYALDEYSGEVTGLDWALATRKTISGCGIAPVSSGEPLRDSRTQVDSAVDVYVPYGADIKALDRLVIRGTTWAVDGEPATWRHPMTGWQPGTVVHAVKVDG
jgi:hypothetical protein